MWNKHGIIFSSNRAQLPVVSRLGNIVYVTFSDRDASGRSRGVLAQLITKNDKFKIEVINSSFLLPGSIGSCDVAGAMPMQILDDKIFYIGWTLRQDVPYFNYTCLATMYDNHIKKLGPILAPDLVDSGYTGTFYVLWNDNAQVYLGYYLSGVGWAKDENSNVQPMYDLKIACSKDLFTWEKTGKVAIALQDDEAGVSAASIYQSNDKRYHMWFSSRKSKHFRGGSGSYKICYAYSENGFDWTRSNKFTLESSSALGENMAAYPSVFKIGDHLHMIYNAKNFGECGISHASLPLSVLD